MAEDLPADPLNPRRFAELTSSQWFSEGNGGESRKSFHGYPDGFAQLLESPTQWHITPMQVGGVRGSETRV